MLGSFREVNMELSHHSDQAIPLVSMYPKCIQKEVNTTYCRDVYPCYCKIIKYKKKNKKAASPRCPALDPAP